MKPDAKWRALLRARPQTPWQLHRFVQVAMGLDVPRRAIEPGHHAPFDYLQHAYFRGGDAVVWACRGGGKTMLGAVATVLELLMNPGMQVRILAGSLEQAARMHEHLTALLDRPMLRGLADGAITQRRVRLVSGAAAELLAMSHRSVRGVRVQKLRCDEVEEIKPDVWQAAQLVTRSARCGEREITAGVEALSTMHRPYGLMHRLTTGPATVLKWNAIDVIERCPPERSCDDCPLRSDCHGRAKHARGYLRIDDLIAMRQRVDAATWASEVMCARPKVSDSVYPSFDVDRHVRAAAGSVDGPCLAGMDFGLRGATAAVWAVEVGSALHVIADYAQTGRTLEQNLAAMQRQVPAALQWIAVDPAGRARNEQTGLSNVQQMKAQGLRVRTTPHRVRDGIATVRRYLDQDRLRIDPACHRLIQAIRSYHFDPAHPAAEAPVKDGPDHLCDALRYLVVTHAARPAPTIVRSYL